MKLAGIIFKGWLVLVGSDFLQDQNGNYVNASKQDILEVEKVGFVAPSPELVDAIYEQSTCRISTVPKEPSNNTSIHTQNIEALKQKNQCKNITLVSDHYKTVVRDLNGIIGIYGWHRKNGNLIQYFYNKHADNYIDYSQAIRLVWPIAYKVNEKTEEMEMIYTEELLRGKNNTLSK